MTRLLISFLLIFVLASNTLYSQKWEVTEPNKIAILGLKDVQPNKALIYNINDLEVKNLLWSAPKEKDVVPASSSTIISLPTANGKFLQFKISEFEMMEEELANKYPEIKTFQGVCVTNPHITVRIDYTSHGLRAMIMDEEAFTYIDHYQRGDKNHKIVYYKNDLQRDGTWSCGFDEELHGSREEEYEEHNSANRQGDCVFRSYRLAVATTAEYSNFHGATSAAQSALVLSAVTTTMNRVNGVMEKDFTVRMILVGNTSSIFYYDAASDPYTNGNGSTMLGQNQATCDNVIGAANYDMGHVFSTGGGGVAFLGCICASNKAGGVTGQASPIGDPFDIDYVAHEMGHQLGGNHTQYNSCNRVNNAAMEPGSASSIMGYAGICSPNVQNNSDAYYHARNIQEIKTEIQLAANNCFTPIAFPNTAPAVATIPNYTIPAGTPFVLTASATDPEGHPMNYCWEQMNAYTAPAQTMPPTATNTTGPAFRTKIPVSSPSRYFPPLANVIAGSANTWEVVPTVARIMNFRVTVRDFTGVAGCTSERDITVTTVASGAFSVTSQNTATTWTEGSTQTITWTVAGTTASPISTPNVDIFLSYDGGLTYPVTLATATPNDGSHNISLPLGTSNTARVMVKGSGNVFYDINNTNIVIQASQQTFNLTLSSSSANICNSSNAQTVINISPINGFNQNVTLSASGLPSGALATFSTNPVSANGNSTLTISNLSGNSGTFIITVQGVSGSINKQATFVLDLSAPLPAPSLSLPSNGATNVALFPTLSWNAVSGATRYNYQVSLSPTFSFLAASGNITTNSSVLQTNLTGNSTYYWRVNAENNCPNNPWSPENNFTTSTCFYYSASDLPKTISPTNINTVTSNVKLYDSGRLETVSVFDLEGTHTNISNLDFTLESTLSGLQVLFWENPCDTSTLNDNFDINFSDGFNPSHPCAPTNGQTYGPENSFSTYLGVSSYGNWKLTVKDEVAGDGGTLSRWAVQACYLGNFCRRLVDHPYTNGIGSLYEAVNCAFSGDTITMSNALRNQTIDLGSLNLVIDKDIVFLANPLDNISIASTSSNPTIEVRPGVNFRIIGMKVFGSNSTEGVIKNEGNLTLENSSLQKNPTITPTSLLKNIGGGTTKIEGTNSIR